LLAERLSYELNDTCLVDLTLDDEIVRDVAKLLGLQHVTF